MNNINSVKKVKGIATLFSGRLHAVPISQQSLFAEYEGVVVNVISFAHSYEEFLLNIKQELEHYFLCFVELSDVKIIHKNSINLYKTISMRKALRAALATQSTQFEIFYAYGKK